ISPQAKEDPHSREGGEENGEEPGFGLGLPGLASPSLASPSMVAPPLNFAMAKQVSDGIYRSGFPIACNFVFVRGLHLRSILCLCPDSVPQGSFEWAKNEGINMMLFDLGVNREPFASMSTKSMRVVMDFIADARNRPILVHCLDGKTQTGCAVGCLRRRQGWSLGAIFDEYMRFAGPRAKALDMQFIELFE
ncbi:unnamed protein product, partial [Choristocarpus tenellus]